MKKFTTSISIIIPCFNEGKTLYRNILSIHKFLSEYFPVFEIIVVDDGSTDNTNAEIQRAKKTIPLQSIKNQKNLGKGSAVRKGVLSAQHDLIAFLDADLAIPIESLLTFVPAIENNFDIVVASRFIPGITIKKKVLLHRRIMEKIFRLLRILILQNTSIQDTQCGFKLFRKAVAKKIFSSLTINRFAFDAEIIFLAVQNNYRIKELPITLQNPTQSSVRIFSDSFNMIIDLLRIRINNYRQLYRNKE